MRPKLFIFILLLVVPIAAVSAMEMPTSIKVNTVPDFNVTVSIRDTSGYYHFQTKDSGEDGSVLIGFEIESSSYDLISMTLKRAGQSEVTHFKRFEDESYITGEFVERDFYPSWYTPPETEQGNETETSNETTEMNSTTNETLEGTENVTATNGEQKLTAFSISDGEVKINGRILLYTLGIIVLVVLIILFIRWEKRKPKKEKKIKVTKLSEVKQKNDDDIKAQEEKIENAKKMLQEAQEELKKLKDPSLNKIEQAKKKLIEDQKELLRLRNEAKKSEQKASEGSNKDENKQ